jgi:hypothetical protein
MSTITPNVGLGKRRSRVRALRPLLVWFIGSLLLLGWYLERRIAEGNSLTFRFLVDGHPVSDGLTVKVDGQPFLSGGRVRFGKRTLAVEGKETELFQKSFSVRFRAIDLGNITLKRSAGTLEVRSEPAPKEVRVAGRLFAGTNTSSSAAFSSLPVGEYQVTATFEHVTEQRIVQVRRNETSRLEIKPAVGTLDVATEPQGTEFKLDAERPGGPALSGKAPVQLSQLPAGEYRLLAWRGDYVKEAKLEIRAGETNRQNIVFEYGEVKFITKPEGVGVFDSFKELGKTPKTVGALKPGQYRFRLQLEGYYPADVSVAVQGKEALVISTNLLNVRYAEAMKTARWLSRPNVEDYRNALASLDEALRLEPDDAEAIALKTTVLSAIKQQEAKLAEEKVRREAAAKRVAETSVQPAPTATTPSLSPASTNRATPTNRVQAAEKHFKDVMATVQNNELFDLHVWKAKAAFPQVREALLRYVEKGADKWAPTNEFKIDEKMSLFRLDPKGGFAEKKFGFVQICGLSDDETEIRCKICLYSVAGPLSGKLGKLIPVHPGAYMSHDPSQAKNWRERVTQRFKDNLAQELGREIK